GRRGREGVRGGQGPDPGPELGDGVTGGDPTPVVGDADGLDVVAVAVDRGEHVEGGDARDVVLGRAPAEEDHQPDALGFGHGATLWRPPCASRPPRSPGPPTAPCTSPPPWARR